MPKENHPRERSHNREPEAALEGAEVTLEGTQSYIGGSQGYAGGNQMPC